VNEFGLSEGERDALVPASLGYVHEDSLQAAVVALVGV